jgi:hypothetical protein
LKENHKKRKAHTAIIAILILNTVSENFLQRNILYPSIWPKATEITKIKISIALICPEMLVYK